MARDSVIPAVDAFGVQRQRLIDRIVRLVQADVTSFDGWYDDALVLELSTQIADRVLAAQRGVGNLTDAYLSRVSTLIVGHGVSPAGVSAAIGQSLRIGQPDLGSVYARLASDYRFRISQGTDVAEALQAVTTRAGVMADTDLALAHRQQAVDFNRKRRVERYRRVLRSERPCGLCAVASDKLYRKADLMPLHGRCRCGVIPVTFSSDPGSTLSNDDLPAIYQAAGGTSAAKLKRVVVEQHGELGPVLTVRGQNFRGPGDLLAA